MPILNEEERRNVLSYQYHGGDSSPIYKYILSPLAQFCVDYFTPKWMAPNLITLLGLIIAVSAGVLTAIYNPTLSLHGPRWLHLYTGVSIFLYQTLDNMDGKQARKTKSSSALGMLFDHGCDALNAGVNIITMGSVLGTGWTTKLFFPLTCAYVPFYFQTWEEYYLGAMILPPFNGPTEGLIMTMIICVLSFLHGPEWFQQTPIELPKSLFPADNAWLTFAHVPKQITPLGIAFIIGYGVTFATAAIQASKVCWVLFWKEKSLVKPLLDLLPFLVFFPSIFYYATHSQVAFPKHPQITVLFFNAVFVEMAIHLMLMHICNSVIKPFKRHGAYAAAVLALYVAVVPKGAHPVVEQTLLFSFSAYFALLTVVTMYRMCTEVAETLDINVLQLGKRRHD